MTDDRKMWLGVAFISIALAALLLLLLWPKPAKAQTCPPDAKSCKVIVVTAEQENVLDQLITQTCIAGPYAQIAEVVKFYKDMLAKAPQGAVTPQGTPQIEKK